MTSAGNLFFPVTGAKGRRPQDSAAITGCRNTVDDENTVSSRTNCAMSPRMGDLGAREC
jgi:hypothetical protein